MSSKEEPGILNVLKWVGIAALVVVPIVVLLRKFREDNGAAAPADEADIFSAELDD